MLNEINYRNNKFLTQEHQNNIFLDFNYPKIRANFEAFAQTISSSTKTDRFSEEYSFLFFKASSCW